MGNFKQGSDLGWLFIGVLLEVGFFLPTAGHGAFEAGYFSNSKVRCSSHYGMLSLPAHHPLMPQEDHSSELSD